MVGGDEGPFRDGRGGSDGSDGLHDEEQHQSDDDDRVAVRDEVEVATPRRCRFGRWPRDVGRRAISFDARAKLREDGAERVKSDEKF